MKIENVHLKDIHISATQGALIRQTNGLEASNVHITTSTGEAFVLAPSVENANIK